VLRKFSRGTSYPTCILSGRDHTGSQIKDPFRDVFRLVSVRPPAGSCDCGHSRGIKIHGTLAYSCFSQLPLTLLGEAGFFIASQLTAPTTPSTPDVEELTSTTPPDVYVMPSTPSSRLVGELQEKHFTLAIGSHGEKPLSQPQTYRLPMPGVEAPLWHSWTKGRLFFSVGTLLVYVQHESEVDEGGRRLSGQSRSLSLFLPRLLADFVDGGEQTGGCGDRPEGVNGISCV